MVKLVYFSRTDNTRRFVEKVLKKKDIEVIKIEKDNMDTITIDDSYILLAPTFGFGEVPEEVERFLDTNYFRMLGVMSSGNRNWGGNFAKAGDIISKRHNVELIGKYELAGTNKDVDLLINYIEKVENQ